MRFILLLWVVLASVAAVTICLVAWAHHPQAAFKDPETGRFDLPYLIYLFSSWFLPLFLGGALTSLVLDKLVRVLGRERWS